jgi:hypothetical protein
MKQQALIKSLSAELEDDADVGKEDPVDLVKTSAWPDAVPSYLIMYSKEEVKLRAYAIMDKFFPDVAGKRFLDYGCGDGAVVAEAVNRQAHAVGYDLFPSVGWRNCDTKMPKGVFDYILVHDVFDHAIGTHHVDMMKQITSVSNADTLLKVRIHPWTSRHGTHCYRYLNKAFIHLLLTPTELRSIGTASQAIPTIPIMNPHEHYDGVFRSSGWKVEKVEAVYDEVDPFLLDHPKIRKRFPVSPEIMRISFIDYQLVKA